jgi:hypothetical protein
MKMICKSKETHTKMKKSPHSATTGMKMMVNQKYQVLIKFLGTQNVPPYKLWRTSISINQPQLELYCQSFLLDLIPYNQIA